MTAETDKEFIEQAAARLEDLGETSELLLRNEGWDRLFALARRGAEMQWRPIQEDYEGEVILWPRGSDVPSHFLPIPPPPKGAEE